jgi:hypothetical protein
VIALALVVVVVVVCLFTDVVVVVCLCTDVVVGGVVEAVVAVVAFALVVVVIVVVGVRLCMTPQTVCCKTRSPANEVVVCTFRLPHIPSFIHSFIN